MKPHSNRSFSAAEWYGATAGGLEALEFLERSSEMAAEPVIADPAIADAIIGVPARAAPDDTSLEIAPQQPHRVAIPAVR